MWSLEYWILPDPYRVLLSVLRPSLFQETKITIVKCASVGGQGTIYCFHLSTWRWWNNVKTTSKTGLWRFWHGNVNFYSLCVNVSFYCISQHYVIPFELSFKPWRDVKLDRDIGCGRIRELTLVSHHVLLPSVSLGIQNTWEAVVAFESWH